MKKGLLILFLILSATAQAAYVRWYMSPISQSGEDWDDGAYAIDKNTSTYAYIGYSFEPIVFTIEPDRGLQKYVRIYASKYSSGFEYNPYVKVEVYSYGAWTTRYEGEITKNTWTEIAVDDEGDARTIEYARVSDPTLPDGDTFRIKEFQFEEMWVAAENVDDSESHWAGDANAIDKDFNTFALSGTGKTGYDGILLFTYPTGFGDAKGFRTEANSIGGNADVEVWFGADESVRVWNGPPFEWKTIVETTQIAFNDYAWILPKDANQELRVYELDVCGDYYEEIVFSLTTTASAGGTVSTGIGKFYYDVNQVVDINATSNLGYHFVNWTGTGVDAGMVADANDGNTTITMAASYTVQANFEQDDAENVTLTLSAEGSGIILTPGEGSFDYAPEAEVEVVAAPKCGNFINWTGTAVDAEKVADPNCYITTVTMSDSYTLIANFSTVTEFTITVYVAVDDNEPSYLTILYASTCPAYKYFYSGELDFLNWTGTAVDWGWVSDPDSSRIYISGEGDCNLICNLSTGVEEDLCTLITDVNGSGGINEPNSSLIIVACGTEVNLVADACDGSEFLRWAGGVAGKVVVTGEGIIPDVTGTYHCSGRYYLDHTGTPLKCFTRTDGEYHIWAGPGSCWYLSAEIGVIGDTYWYSSEFSGNEYFLLDFVNNNGGDSEGAITTAYSCCLIADDNDVSTTADINEDTTAVANFRSLFTLSIYIQTDSNDPVLQSMVQCSYGEVIPVEATELEGDAVFNYWYGYAVDIGKVDNPLSGAINVTVDGNYSITAYFQSAEGEDSETMKRGHKRKLQGV